MRAPRARGAIAIGAVAGALALPGAASAALHATTTVHAVGDGTTTPQRIAAGDFNGDGVTDLVAAGLNATAGDFTVLRGIGAGAFEGPRRFQAPPRPESVAVADFDGDGLSDLALPANATPGSVRVLVSNGDLTFGAGATISLAPQADDVVAGHFDGDATMDLAIATPGAVTIATGVGDGTFRPPLPPVPTGAGTARETLAAGDVNGDGRDDVIASPGATVAGAPSVATMVTAANGALSSGATPTAVASAPGRPVTADFNGDGRADVVVPLAASNAAAVMLSAPDGSLGAPRALAVPSPGAVAVGDADQDGRADVMVAGATGAVSGFPGNGDGTFGPQVPVAGASGAGFTTALGADLNGDGFTDLALGSPGAPGRVTVALNAPSAAPSAASLTFASTVAGAAAPAQTVSLTNDGQPPLRVSGVSLGGANPGDFKVVGDGCTGAVLAAGASCPVTLAMSPLVAGARAAQVAFASNSAEGVARVALAGTGLAPPAAPPKATPDRTAPTVGLTVRAQRLREVLRQGLRATVSCSEACTADVRLVLSRALARRYHLPSKTAFVVARRTLRFKKSGRLPIRLRLTRRARRALGNAGRITFTLRVASRDAAGNTRTRTNTVALQR